MASILDGIVVKGSATTHAITSLSSHNDNKL